MANDHETPAGAVTIRSRRRATPLTALLILAAAMVAPGAVSAASAPQAAMDCGNGVVTTLTPTVSAQQWAESWDVFLSVELWQYSSAGWRVYDTSHRFAAEAMTGDFNPGSTTGWAGPWWYDTAIGGYYRAVMFLAPSGYSYAVRHVVQEAGTTSEAWAQWTRYGQSYGSVCSA